MTDDISEKENSSVETILPICSPEMRHFISIEGEKLFSIIWTPSAGNISLLRLLKDDRQKFHFEIFLS